MTAFNEDTYAGQFSIGVHEQLPESAEVASYYVVAEALTNTAKHAQASTVDVASMPTTLISISRLRDDGIGGAAVGKGSGLTGLVDRVEALGDTMDISSPVAAR